jgi:(1->4)-alpha-D-glucan 1-alpha-D-glucosylmutase
MDAINHSDELLDELVELFWQSLGSRLREPDATYRVQFDAGHFTFRDAADVIPYLNELGVSHVYASPCLKARSGSAHGYAIVDYTVLNPDLGGRQGFEDMVATLQSHGMGQILDFVPNHMSAAPGENPWWDDVLENGPSSPYSRFFDVDWRPLKEELRNKVLLPVLGQQFGRALEAGELVLQYGEGAFFIKYYDTRLPLDPRTYATPLTDRLDELRESMPDDSDDLRELESILTAIDYLPERTETGADRVEERQREKEVIKSRLRRLTRSSPPIADFIDRNVREFNGTAGRPATFDRLEELLDAQAYRLAHWKAAADEINYRRFFDINDLAAVSMEDPDAFEESHRLVLDLLASGKAAGLRIDHIDGLFDPLEYLWRLQWGYVRALGAKVHEQLRARVPVTPDGFVEPGEPGEEGPEWEEIEPRFLDAAWERLRGTRPERVFPMVALANKMPDMHDAAGFGAQDPAAHDGPWSELPLYIVVEKILGPEEPLPSEWPVAGTTGYDFLNFVGGLFVEPRGLAELTKVYHRFTGEKTGFDHVAHRAKLLILRAAMASDLQLLAHRLNRISERHRSCRDFTMNTLRAALREILACFPVYRTYIGPRGLSDRDREVLDRAVRQAKRRLPTVDAAVFDFIRGVLLLEQPPDLDEAGRREREFFVGRFQQVTSPVTAKGVEDTAFYRYVPLCSLNEVGGEPDHAAVTVDEFHQENGARQRERPGSLLCTSSHDTKRSEDVRARINVLSEVPRMWRTALGRWARLNRRHRREVDGEPAPSRNDEYLFYQTLLGAWPLDPPDEETHGRLIERLTAYMEKATHEAKRHTSWISPDPDYDVAVREFVAAVLDRGPKNRFLGEFQTFHEKTVDWGLYTALSQAFLKLTSPGVPDVYQGQELWDFSLVDPDNRRPVDYGLRRELLDDLSGRVAPGDDARLATARELAASPRDHRLKLFVTWQTLRFRRRHAGLFRTGRYVPLEAEGSRARLVCGFAWQSDAAGDGSPAVAIVVAPRLLAQLCLPREQDGGPAPPVGASVWEDTQLRVPADTPWPLRNLLTGQQVSFDRPSLPLAAALSDFPLALLTNLPD